jgi:hypothetical protein
MSWVLDVASGKTSWARAFVRNPSSVTSGFAVTDASRCPSGADGELEHDPHNIATTNINVRWRMMETSVEGFGIGGSFSSSTDAVSSVRRSLSRG